MLNVTKNDIRDWQVYKLENPSGSVYVGLTCNMYIRFIKYKRADCKYQKALYNSIKKHGFDNHKIEVLDSFKSNFNYASGKEMFWIRSYMSNVSKYPSINGMNLTNGGEGNVGYVTSDETRKKQSLAKKGRSSPLKGRAIWSEEQKKKIGDFHKGNKYRLGQKNSEAQNKKHSEIMKGRLVWNKGIPVPDDVRKKISATLMGRPSPLKGKPSTMSLEGREKVRQANLGQKRTLGHKATPETIERLRISHLGNTSRCRPVAKFSLDMVKVEDYSSLKEAANKLGITTVTARNYIRGKTKSVPYFLKYIK